MPEATVLYSVTAVVIAALLIWVALVLKTAKEPWGRAAPMRVLPADVDIEPPLHVGSSDAHPSSTLDADETAKATPVALAGEGRATSHRPADEDKSDVP